MNPNGLPAPSKGPVIIAGVMTLAFIGALGFGIWAFAGLQDNKNNLEEKIDAAITVAVQEAESAKDVEFAEEIKSPYKSYTGSATYGSLTFDYPKSWSIYAEDKTSGTILDFYGQPDLIPGIDKGKVFAFRAQILDDAYDDEAKDYIKLAEKGTVTITAFRPVKVPETLGILVRGEIKKGKTGILLLLPQRDKSFKLWTESNDYAGDFSKILESLTFTP